MSIKCDPQLSDQFVADTGLKAGNIVAILVKHDSKFQKAVKGQQLVTKISAVDISEGKGFVTKVYKTKIFVDGQEDPVYSFVMKIPTSECMTGLMGDALGDDTKNIEMFKEGTMLEKLAKFHNIECDFYDTFRNIPDYPLPNVSYTQKMKEGQVGVIFMEDLSGQMTNLGFFCSLNVYQIKNMVKHYAAFHAYQLANEDKWKGRFDDLAFEDDFMDMLVTCSKKAMEIHPEWKPYMEKLDRVTFDKEIMDYCAKACCKDLGLPMLINQGDCNTNNVLWKKRENNVPNEVLAFIDFQIAFAGNPARDMAQIITLFTDAEVRREVETFICDFYYEHLTNFLKSYGKTPSFKVEKFKVAYDYAMISQAGIQAMFSVLINGMKAEVSEEVKEAWIEKASLKTKLCLVDAVERLEKIHPEWIPKVEENGA